MLLGASNLRRALPSALRLARERLGAPLEFLVATGAGRSYGARSTVVLRSLPGILECGLWAELREAEPLPTYALIADVGNDIVYGARPERILAWVAEGLERLEAVGAQSVAALFPPGNAASLPPWLFHAVARTLYPFRRIDRARILADVDAVDAGLRELFARRGVATVDLRREWYGLDPVHLRARDRDVAWRTVFAAWPAGGSAGVPVSDDPSTARAFVAAPQLRSWAGFEQRAPQPALVLGDGSRVSLF